MARSRPKHVERIGVTEIAPVIAYLQKHGIGEKEIKQAWKSAGGSDALVRFTRRRLNRSKDGQKPTKTKREISVSPRKVSRKSADLINEIREFCRSQKELWRRVPNLALEADGRDGYSDQYGRAYYSGYWALGSAASRGVYNVYIDLATGELVSSHNYQELAADRYVLRMAFCLDEIDAEKVIAELETSSKEPYSCIYDPEEQEAWRASRREELGLEVLYTRKEELDAKKINTWIDC